MPQVHEDPRTAAGAQEMPHCPHRWAQVRKASTESFIELLLNTPFPCHTPSSHKGFGGHRVGELGMGGVRKICSLWIDGGPAVPKRGSRHQQEKPQVPQARGMDQCKAAEHHASPDPYCSAGLCSDLNLMDSRPVSPGGDHFTGCHCRLLCSFFRWPDIYLAFK